MSFARRTSFRTYGVGKDQVNAVSRAGDVEFDRIFGEIIRMRRITPTCRKPFGCSPKGFLVLIGSLRLKNFATGFALKRLKPSLNLPML